MYEASVSAAVPPLSGSLEAAMSASSLLGLPAELIFHITGLLPLSSRVSLAIACKALLHLSPGFSPSSDSPFEELKTCQPQHGYLCLWRTQQVVSSGCAWGDFVTILARDLQATHRLCHLSHRFLPIQWKGSVEQAFTDVSSGLPTLVMSMASGPTHASMTVTLCDLTRATDWEMHLIPHTSAEPLKVMTKLDAHFQSCGRPFPKKPACSHRDECISNMNSRTRHHRTHRIMLGPDAVAHLQAPMTRAGINKVAKSSSGTPTTSTSIGIPAELCFRPCSHFAWERIEIGGPASTATEDFKRRTVSKNMHQLYTAPVRVPFRSTVARHTKTSQMRHDLMLSAKAAAAAAAATAGSKLTDSSAEAHAVSSTAGPAYKATSVRTVRHSMAKCKTCHTYFSLTLHRHPAPSVDETLGEPDDERSLLELVLDVWQNYGTLRSLAALSEKATSVQRMRVVPSGYALPDSQLPVGWNYCWGGHSGRAASPRREMDVGVFTTKAMAEEELSSAVGKWWMYPPGAEPGSSGVHHPSLWTPDGLQTLSPVLNDLSHSA